MFVVSVSPWKRLTLVFLALLGVSVSSLLRLIVQVNVHYEHHERDDIGLMPPNRSVRGRGRDRDDDFYGHRPHQTGLSACLLIKDANHRLPEWLAYHYHVLPLRYLIVGVDAESKTSPSDILKLWNTTEMGMTIVEWTDDKFIPVEMKESRPRDDARPEVKKKAFFKRYRERQDWFLSQCVRALKRENRRWTILGDIDEYVLFNRFRDWASEEELVATHSGCESVSTMKDDLVKKLKSLYNGNKLSGQGPLPSIQNTTVAEFIDAEESKGSFPWNETCIQIPRLFFGGKESAIEEIKRDVPSNFEPMKFDTIRFRHHGKRGCWWHNKWVKVMIDSSRVPDSYLNGVKAHNPHTFGPVCRFESFSQELYNDAPLIMNHYEGPRGSLKRWEERYDETVKFVDGTNDEISPWLINFVRVHGEEKASKLLYGISEQRSP